MNAKVIIKEARPLFWPWCAVILAGVMTLIRPLNSISWISLIAFFLGIPLLATLPLGYEFQHRTFSLLLSQPVPRIRIWAEKLFFSGVAVISVVLVFSVSPRTAAAVPNVGERAIVGALIVATIASATFWTLFTRSTIGGVALTVGALVAIVMFLAIEAGGFDDFLSANFARVSTTALLCYAGLMLWLGERKLARYQVTGNMAGDDLVTAGSDLMPEAFASWLRCRPSGLALNLVRKEIRLLRPVWIITVLSAPGWVCLTVFILVRERRPTNDLPLATVVLGVSCALIIAILAGCLSLGEEKTSGTYTWHRSLPASALLQWFAKLFVALSVGFLCAGLLPVVLMMAGKFFFGSPFVPEDPHFQIMWLLGLLVLTAASFLCACAVNGTVPAVLWVSPLLIAVTLVPEIGDWSGSRFGGFIVSKFDLFADFRLAVAASNGVRFALFDVGFGSPRGYLSISELFVVWVPTLILAVFQSYRLFKAPIQAGAVASVGKLLPIAILAFLCSSFFFGFLKIADEAAYEVVMLPLGVHEAIENILSSDATQEAGHPLELTVDNLENGHPLRPDTLRWLANSRITVTRDKLHATPTYLGAGSAHRALWSYTATIQLASGAEVTQSWELPGDRATAESFNLNARVHWPGTVGDEPLFGR